MLRQRTLRGPVQAIGIGLHSGQRVSLNIKPGPIDSGIVYRRVDLDPVVELPALAHRITDTRLNTTLSADVEGPGLQVSVHTIEHLMSALAGLGIDNAQIDITASEVPILDGSAAARGMAAPGGAARPPLGGTPDRAAGQTGAQAPGQPAAARGALHADTAGGPDAGPGMASSGQGGDAAMDARARARQMAAAMVARGSNGPGGPRQAPVSGAPAAAPRQTGARQPAGGESPTRSSADDDRPRPARQDLYFDTSADRRSQASPDLS